MTVIYKSTWFPVVFMKAILNFSRFTSAAGVKEAEVKAELNNLSINHYLRIPSFTFSRPANASNPARIVLAKTRVPTISQPVASPKILPSVIMANMVDMIRVVIRKFPKHIEKSKPVGKVELAVNPDLKVAFPVVASSNIPDVYSAGGFNQPSKFSSFRRIMKKLPKPCLSKNAIFSHFRASCVVSNGQLQMAVPVLYHKAMLLI